MTGFGESRALKMKGARASALLLAVILLFLLLAACSAPPVEETIEPANTAAPAVETSPIPEGDTQPPSQEEGDAGTEDVFNTPTPAPTATPDALTEIVSNVVSRTGMEQTQFLVLTVEDWINLGISMLIVLGGALVLGRLVYVALIRITSHTPTEYDSALIQSIRLQIHWVIGTISFQIATKRLLFLNPAVKQTLDTVYFNIYVIAAVIVGFKLIDLAGKWAHEDAAKRGDIEQKEAVLILSQRLARLLIATIGLIIILDGWGVNVSALLAVLGIAGLALSLAAQDTLANMITGVLILLDQPFRVGDRIEIQELGTWGDVVEIGLRTTRIRTRDNRMVIVPNATIGTNQVVNYTFPDPRYRVEIDLSLAYGVDIPQVRALLTEAIHSLEDVLPDKPVDVLLLDFGEESVVIRVRWWIDSYADTRHTFDRVNEAIYAALNNAGIAMSTNAMDIYVKKEPG